MRPQTNRPHPFWASENVGGEPRLLVETGKRWAVPLNELLGGTTPQDAGTLYCLKVLSSGNLLAAIAEKPYAAMDTVR